MARISQRRTTALAALIILAAGLFWIGVCYSEERFPGMGILKDERVPWRITARSLSYKEKEGVYEAEGDVVISKGDQSLYAQKAVYNTKTGIARVRGSVSLEAGGDVLSGDEGVFDLNRKTGRIKNGALFLRENHYFISGDAMEKLAEDTYLISDCQLTTCDGTHPAWSITASEVRVTIEGYGRVKNATFRIRGFPIFYVPYMIIPAKTKRQTGLLPPRLGYSGRNGPDVELPLFWAISDETDATFYQRFMGKRGYMQGAEFRYVAPKNSKAIFLADVLSDRKGKKDMNNADDLELSPLPRTNRTRYWLRGRADQALPYEVRARMDADYVSDQDYLMEFEGGLFGLEVRPDLVEETGRPLEERRSPTRRSALRLSRDGEDYSLQAAASYHQRPEDLSEDLTPQPLGGLAFSWLPSQVLDLPMFFGLESDYGYVWRDVGATGNRVSLSPKLQFPLWPTRHLELEPSFRYTLNRQWFTNPGIQAEDQFKGAYEASVRLMTSLERTYDAHWQNARRLKHRIWPTLSYTYRVPHDQRISNPWFEPIDVEDKVSRIAFSVENFLDARLEDKQGRASYRQWANLTITQGYDVNEARRIEEPQREKRPFEPLSAVLTVKPFPDIDVYSVAKWDHYEHRISFADVSLELALDRAGNRRDRFKVDYHYEWGTQKSLNFWANVNLSYGFSVGSSLERDLLLSQNISSGYWAAYEDQCWGIKLVAEDEDEETRVFLVFNLLGLGEIRSW